jgi:hypothetical protein
MKASWGMLARPVGPALLAVAILALPLALAQGPYTFNEREVRSQASALDKSDVWTMDFRFKDPRLIKVNIPARGPRICWYMWYQVINRTGQPRKINLNFDLVTLEHPAVYPDDGGTLPCVEDAIRKREDPTGYQDIKNSVTIANEPIPASKADNEAFPRAVTGVAIWDGASADPKLRDANKKDLSDANRFTIFVSGLSNGQVEVDPLLRDKTEAPVVRRKTLQLNFKRLGDRYYMDSREISFVPPSEWVYRASQIKIPERQADKGPPMAPKAPAAALSFQLPGQ